MVIDEAAPLSEWVWRRVRLTCQHESFGYRRGVSKEIDLGDGLTTFKEIGLKAHGGWGTYFTAQKNAQYDLVVALQEAVPPGFQVELVAHGGGWK